MKRLKDFIPELKDYYTIDEFGNLYSNNKRISDNHITGGYIINNLALETGKQKCFKRHRLVMLCFDPVDNSENLQVNHKDGNKLNNNLNNLEWVTSKENIKHSWENGLSKFTPSRKKEKTYLTEQDVFDILNFIWKNKLPRKQIAEKYNISENYITRIKHGKRWNKIYNIFKKENQELFND